MVLLLASTLAFAQPPLSVVGGERAPDGAWPDAAAIGFNWGIGCTGTLIAPDLVLTAGHCAYGIKYVVVDHVDYEDGTGERIAVTEIHEHPDSQKTYDVAVLVLEREATTPYRPLLLDCLVDEHLKDGAEVAIVGWGANDVNANRYDSILRQAFTTVGDADCSDTDRGCQRPVSPGGELIAGGDGIDSCNGDSGGPLYLLGEDGAAWLVGVTSRAAWPADTYCGDGGIYVRVDAVADWIESETGRTLDRPVCGEPINHAPAPRAEPMYVEQGASETTTIDANDPDDGDAHVITLLYRDEGAVEIGADGAVTYTAAASGAIGPDNFVLVVTDDGEPPLSASVEVEVIVLERPVVEDTDTVDDVPDDDDEVGDVQLRAAGGCGCATGGAPGWAALAGVALAFVRRKR